MQLMRNIPVTPTNLDIDDRGLVYTVTQGIGASGGLRKLNMAGRNILNAEIVDQFVSDVAVGSLGNIFVVTSEGYIYEYTREGDLLFLFGGTDDGTNREGLFINAKAIDIDSQGYIYVLDGEKNIIQIFEPTEYARIVHEALELYQSGYYIQSRKPWEYVIQQNSLFDYAHKAIGEAYFKLGMYGSALNSFYLGGYRSGFSDALWEVRNVWLRNNLQTIFFALLIAFIFRKLLRFLKPKCTVFRSLQNLYQYFKNTKIIKELQFIFYVIINPADAFYGIKHEGKVSIISASILYVLFFSIYVADKYFSGFLFKNVPEGRYDIVSDAGFIFGTLTLLIICNHLICSINDGEGRMYDVYCGFAYALAPYILVKPILVFISHFVTFNEAFILQFSEGIIYLYAAILTIISDSA